MSDSPISRTYVLINPRPKHFEQIQELCKRVYPFSKPWSLEQLESHRACFPDGQLIVVEEETEKVVGLAFSLIVMWNDYSSQDNWKDFTSGGFFHNHNPNKGKTLYGAEVMVDPELRGQGIGKMLYQGRKQIVEKYGLKRIRAGARLRGYGKFQDKLEPDAYVKQVVEKKIYDPTLSFQLNQGFEVIDVAPNYLFNDPESLGYAAVIEWLNPNTASQKDIDKQQHRIKNFLEDEKLVLEFLPRELRRLVRKATLTLGQIIRESEGDKFFRRVEYYREQLKKTRKTKSKERLIQLLAELKKESKADRQKLAHAFSLQLELVNICEAAYRTWRLRQKPITQGVKSKLSLTYVLTAHPTEARSKLNVEILNKLEKLFIDAIHGNFLFNDDELSSKMRMIWLHPLSKINTPTVLDEAEYMYSLIFSPDLFDFILSDKPSYDLKLRTWVGGDKDGHPYVNKDVMKECLNRSRTYILEIVQEKIELVLSDLNKLKDSGKIKKSEVDGLKSLIIGLKKLQTITTGDGTKLKTWTMKYHSTLKGAGKLVKRHSQILLINRLLIMFPAFVFPIELREDAGLIKDGLKDNSSAIRGMLSELSKAAGALDITSYARGLVISHCESAEDIENACNLVYQVTKRKTLPVIPLFETNNALVNAKKILRNWLKERKNQDLAIRQWGGRFETMLGYSDSSKQTGVLPSRYLIAKAMVEIEKVIKSTGIKPIFFHGSGGSVARGGGSLKEQIAWWPNSAIDNPKFTVQGEMIQRQFATKEILNSQCIHMANESRRRKLRSVQLDQSKELENFVSLVQTEYTKLVENGPLLTKLLEATPYRYLDKLKIGSRPSKRPGKVVSLSALRAIPWVLCWTQSRALLPTWWGVGAAWKALSVEERKKIVDLFSTSPFLSSFVKALGFSLAKVELEIWELYFAKNADDQLFKDLKKEYLGAIKFVLEVSQQKTLIWHRPWLEESIKLRSSNIHILNLLQIIAINDADETLLKETIVGIACGMLTTG